MVTLNPRIIPLLGLEFNNINLDETTRRLLARPHGARFAYVVTPNADHIVRLWRIPRLRHVYLRAMLCLLDSQFIGLCARRLGLPRPPVVTGADLTSRLLEHLTDARVAVIGMDPNVIALLAARYPSITFLHHQPPMGLLHRIPEFFAARDFAIEAQADFTFLAVGSPVQELLAYAIALRRESTGLGLCIGSALAFSAGTQPRAPDWMRARGLEWLYRLAREPARLAGRYLVDDPRVFFGLIKAAVRQRAR
jgi:exopolysaccharide biosynthesis WecB/TagA/CpsF family protein